MTFRVEASFGAAVVMNADDAMMVAVTCVGKTYVIPLENLDAWTADLLAERRWTARERALMAMICTMARTAVATIEQLSSVSQ